MNANHTTATAEADPDAAVVRSDDRVNGTVGSADAGSAGCQGVEAVSVEAKQTGWRRLPRDTLRGPARWRTRRLGTPFSDAHTAIA